MNKSDKKIENLLVKSLTEVCETTLHTVAGFEWITHFVNYKHFPQSLSIVCIFNTEAELQQIYTSKNDIYLHTLIQDKLSAAGIKLTNIDQHVSFDTEEACTRENNGKWNERFKH